MKGSRFALFRGSYQEPPKTGHAHVLSALLDIAKESRLDFTSVTMQDSGHTFPEMYHGTLGRWARGEKLVTDQTK
jgi:hypothetical protein